VFQILACAETGKARGPKIRSWRGTDGDRVEEDSQHFNIIGCVSPRSRCRHRLAAGGQRLAIEKKLCRLTARCIQLQIRNTVSQQFVGTTMISIRDQTRMC